MTNTKFRKRALLSSVAMLLVALVALGSATFAWFTANPNASAAGLKLKTTASSGLVVRTQTDPVWDHDAILNAKLNDTSGEFEADTAAFDLQPTSQSQTSGAAATFYKLDAKDADNYHADAQAVGTANLGGPSASALATASAGVTVNSGDVYAEKIYFRLSDGAANLTAAEAKNVYLKNVSINTAANSPTLFNAIRVAVADKNGTIIGTYAPAAVSNQTLTGGTFPGYTKDTSVNPATYTLAGEYTFANFSPAVLTSVPSAGTLVTGFAGTDLRADSSNTDNYVTVYVWLDGEDAACYSDNVGTVNAAAIVDSIQLDFTLKAAA